MAFFKRSPDIHPYEGHLFMYWVTVLQLLKIGVAWEAIQNFSSRETNMILGVQAAMSQREQDDMAREQAKTFGSSKFRSM